jgi:predicted Ser/Thr protein kinase
MASWPAQADYRDALQNPDVAFRDPILRRAAVELNRMKVPRARSGAFASVYKLTHTSGQSVALKLFNFPSDDRQRRYEEVSKHLAGLSGRKPDSLVGFSYQREGIKIGASWYPIQTMDWVKGESLGEWVRKRMTAKDVPAVRAMADKWVQLVCKLQAADIAHGDLQHDNVMVRDNTPLLVDYDGMWVPKLDGAEPLEFGKPAYQHPRRGKMKLNRGLDHFSAWVILIAMRAMTADPTLFTRFVVQPDNENVLFSPSDLSDHAKSALWPELLRSKDADVARWSADLRASLDHPAERVPPFSMDPFQSIRALCEAVSRDWDAIVVEADRLTAANRPLPVDPKHLTQRVTEARQRVQCRDRIRKAFQDGDLRAMVAAYQPALFDQWPIQRGLVSQVTTAIAQVKLLDELKAAGQNEQKQAELWAKYGPQLSGVKEAEPYGKRVEATLNRLKAARPFLALFKDPAATELAYANAWKAILAAGEQPGSLTPAHRERGELALKRSAALDRFKTISPVLSEVADRQLVQVWAANEAALTGFAEADALRVRATQAKVRLAAVEKVNAAVARLGKGGTADDIIRASEAARLPVGYTYTGRDLVDRLKAGEKLSQDLRRAVEATVPSEKTIAASYEKMKADLLRAATIPPDHALRGELAVRRVAALAQLDAVSASNLHTRDIQLLLAFRDVRDVFRNCTDPLMLAAVARVKAVNERVLKWKQLKAAIDAKDAAAVAAVGRDPEMMSYPPLFARHAEWAALLKSGERLSGIRAKVTAGPKVILTADEIVTLRESHHLFSDAEKQLLLILARRSVVHLAKMAAGSPPYKTVPGDHAAAMVFWSWSATLAVRQFVLTVTPQQLYALADAKDENRAYCRLEDYKREGDGRLVLLGGSGPRYVQVWPEADLGFALVHGDPLTFGPIMAGGGR